MNRLFREEGASRFKVLFWLVLLFVVVHIGVQIIPMYLDFWRMEDEIKSKAATAQVAKPGDDEIKNALVKYAKGLNLPSEAENIVVTRSEEQRTMMISTAWDIELRFFWGICGEPCVRKYHFQIAEEGKM